jgi:hypothetical protein
MGACLSKKYFTALGSSVYSKAFLAAKVYMGLTRKQMLPDINFM